MPVRSWLFVPGDSERKLAKAPETGADAIIVDLEDAVAAESKPLARGLASEWLAAHRSHVVAGRRTERWVRIDAYLDGLLQRRIARRSHRMASRSEPEAPRAILSTWPFLALLAVLGLLIVAFAVTAFPPSQPKFEPAKAKKELGTAAPGWFEEAKKQFR